MKKHSSICLALIALSGALISPALSAAEPLATTNPALPITAVRAKEQIGAAVYSTDGFRVGAVADYVLQFDSLPQLRYVIIKSGPTVALRADQRAIPADAITFVDGQVHVSLTHTDFDALPVLTAIHRTFLANPANLITLAQKCGTPVEHAALGANYVVFSKLTDLSEVMASDGESLGYFSDLWIDFNANEAPYLEYDPIGGIADFAGTLEYDVPTNKLSGLVKGEIHLAMTGAELAQARTIDDPRAFIAAAGEKMVSFQNKQVE